MARCAESDVAGGGDGKWIAIANGDTKGRRRIGGSGEYTRVSETMCEVAPESMTHAPGVEGPAAGAPTVAFRAATRAEQSHAGPGVSGTAGGGGLVPQAWPCNGASWVM